MAKQIRLSVNQSFMDNLKETAGIAKASELTQEALTLYNWALNEVKKGRMLISMDRDGGNQKQIVTPILEKASKNVPAQQQMVEAD